jgi:adenine-specific DNA-methyltransferase
MVLAAHRSRFPASAQIGYSIRAEYVQSASCNKVESTMAIPVQAALPLASRSPRKAPNGDLQRAMGAYYTPITAADYMADWAVRGAGEHVLEPSVGDGSFLRAVKASAARRDLAKPILSGFLLAGAVEDDLLDPAHAHGGDFLALDPFPVAAAIGNPPFVRLRHLPPEERDRALAAAELAMGRGMDPAGSVWLPFLLHAMRFLTPGGRLAFVLPYEATYVRYARPLWEALGAHFGSLRVIRTHERLFADLYQDVILLLADDFGSHTAAVHYQVFERIADLLADRAAIEATIPIADLMQGKRAFIAALLSDELQTLLTARLNPLTSPARERITWNIGYVSGDKEFFHPNAATVAAYALPNSSLHKSVTSARALRGAGLYTHAAPGSATERLFLPDRSSLTVGEQRYIAWGERQGVANRYKCRVRKPWYVTPDTRTPDIVVSVFSERPVLLVNDGGCLASNSLLCGFLRAGTAAELAAGWYTSLTLLQCELEVHALGGGVMVLIPGETGRIRLPQRVEAAPDHLATLDRLLRAGQTALAYRAGDRAILMTQLGLSEHEVELIRHGVETLAHWRTSARSSLR